MPAGYAPLYFASMVLANVPAGGKGRFVLVEGGEYNGCKKSWTSSGAIYDTDADTWTPVAPPSPWTNIGDAQSVALPCITGGDRYCNSHPVQAFALAQACNDNGQRCIPSYGEVIGLAYFNGSRPEVTFPQGQEGKADPNDEEGWTLLPYQSGNYHNRILTVDTCSLGAQQPDCDTRNSELADLDPFYAFSWQSSGRTKNQLVDPFPDSEIGPAVLLPSGHVFQAGVNSCGAPTRCMAFINVYQPENARWVKAGAFPQISGLYYDVADGPAALLPSGKVLIQSSPGLMNASPSHFFEFDEADSSLTRVDDTTTANEIAAYQGRMLELPTGQILWSATATGWNAPPTNDIEIYTPNGAPKSAWRPIIDSLSSSTLSIGSTYTINGRLLNGLSQGAAYGDDAQMSTNFPLVRLINKKTFHVCFAYTETSSMAIADHDPDSMTFLVPKQLPPGVQPCDTGQNILQVIANGIASKPLEISLK